MVVIDEDLGRSGASATDRYGFQRLVTEISLGHVGLVLGIEMSRLAGSGKDCYQLIELCALSGALLADIDGVYDPAQYNDRLGRHEVLCDRVEVKDLRRRVAAAA